MNYIDVYMTESDSTRGQLYSAGYIYHVEDHIAKQFEEEGKGRVINYSSLNAHRENVTVLAAQLENEIESIKANKRLSEEGRQEDITTLLKEYKDEIARVQEKYNSDLQTLQNASKKAASSFKLDDTFNPDQVRYQAGIIRAEIEMSSSLTYAANAIQSKLDIIDKATARELLSHFTEIKKSLEEKGANISDTLRRTTIRNVYEDLKKVAEDESQANANTEYRVFEAIKQYRGDITEPYKALIRKYSSAASLLN